MKRGKGDTDSFQHLLKCPVSSEHLPHAQALER